MRKETQETICTWADRTFGPTDLRYAYNRYWKEAVELDELMQPSLIRNSKIKPEPAKLAEECADVLITLFRVAHVEGFDLMQEVDKKMSINRGRKWKVTGSGVGQHE